MPTIPGRCDGRCTASECQPACQTVLGWAILSKNARCGPILLFSVWLGQYLLMGTVVSSGTYLFRQLSHRPPGSVLQDHVDPQRDIALPKLYATNSYVLNALYPLLVCKTVEASSTPEATRLERCMMQNVRITARSGLVQGLLHSQPWKL